MEISALYIEVRRKLLIDLLKWANIPSIHTHQQNAQISWEVHVVRMPDGQLLKPSLYSDQLEGKRSVRGQEFINFI